MKMQHVVHDVAIWIASSLEDEIQAGKNLSQMPEVGMWKSLKRVSFMDNRITWLPASMMPCFEVSTLLLQRNYLLEKVPEGFLLGFQSLRVLNLGVTLIRTLPLSLLELSELRALLLKDCFYLEEVPPLRGLSRLQMLNLCGTCFRDLPKWLEELSSLRQLNLSRMLFVNIVQATTILGMSSLEELDMSSSSFKWDVNEESTVERATLKELGYLKCLSSISIGLRDITHSP